MRVAFYQNVAVKSAAFERVPAKFWVSSHSYSFGSIDVRIAQEKSDKKRAINRTDSSNVSYRGSLAECYLSSKSVSIGGTDQRKLRIERWVSWQIW